MTDLSSSWRPRYWYEKEKVRSATTCSNITIDSALNEGNTLDGVTLANGDRVLVKDQTTKSENGIYVVAASPSRAEDANAAGKLSGGSVVFVEEGVANAGTGWVIATNRSITPGTTAHDWGELVAAPEDGDVYFDLEFVQQTESQAFGFEDKDQTLLTSIAGVVRDGDTYQSIYQVNGTNKAPEIATGGDGEKRVIFSFLEALLTHLNSFPKGPCEIPRMFNYSGGGNAESRLQKRITNLGLRSLTQEEFTKLGISLGDAEPKETRQWNEVWEKLEALIDPEKIRKDDLNDVLARRFGRFPNPPSAPGHGLKAIERYVPGLSGRVAVGSATESKEVWRRIRSLRNIVIQTLIGLPDSAAMPASLEKLQSFLREKHRAPRPGGPQLAPDLWDLIPLDLLTPLGFPGEAWAAGATAATEKSSSELGRFVSGLKCEPERTATEWARIWKWNAERLELETLYTLYATMDCVSLLRVHEYAEKVLRSQGTRRGRRNFEQVDRAVRRFPEHLGSTVGS